MSRFHNVFSNHSLSFIPFFVLGYPTLDKCFDLMDQAIDAGAQALELGIPFSDPIADGPIIQQAYEQVLKAQHPLRAYFKLISKIRDKHPTLPIGLLVYAQTIEHAGLLNFYTQAQEAGVDGILVADCPLFENTPYAQMAQKLGLDNMLITAPSTPANALEHIAKSATGYVYVVTRKGVTGITQEIDLENIYRQINQLQAYGSPPCVLGFGIKSQEDVYQISCTPAKGYIVGSYLVDRIAQDNHSMFDTVKTLLAGQDIVPTSF